MQHYELFTKIRGWAEARNLVDGSTPEKQFTKLVEETGELAAGIMRQNKGAIMDGIGDAVGRVLIEIQRSGAESHVEIDKNRRGVEIARNKKRQIVGNR